MDGLAHSADIYSGSCVVFPQEDVAGWAYAKAMVQELRVLLYPGICVLVTHGFGSHVAIWGSTHFAHCGMAGLCDALVCSLHHQDGLFIDHAVVLLSFGVGQG